MYEATLEQNIQPTPENCFFKMKFKVLLSHLIVVTFLLFVRNFKQLGPVLVEYFTIAIMKMNIWSFVKKFSNPKVFENYFENFTLIFILKMKFFLENFFMIKKLQIFLKKEFE